MLRLLTNIQMVIVEVNGTRLSLSCNAVLLEERPADLRTAASLYEIRGFKTTASTEVFQYPLRCPNANYTEEDAPSNAHFVGQNGEPRPLAHGKILTFEDGLRLCMILEDTERDLDVSDYQEIRQVWKALTRKVAEYWMAPSFPVVVYRLKREALELQEKIDSIY